MTFHMRDTQAIAASYHRESWHAACPRHVRAHNGWRGGAAATGGKTCNGPFALCRDGLRAWRRAGARTASHRMACLLAIS